MFRTVVLALWVLFHAYLAWRVVSLPAVARRVRARWVVLAFALLALTVPISRTLERAGPPWLAHPLEWLAAHWLGVALLLVVCLLAVDLVTLFGHVLRRHAARLRGCALVAGAALSVVALVQGYRAPVVEDYEVTLPGLPPEADGLVIALVSDTHLGALVGPGWLAARVAQVQSLSPDLVLLAGDIVEGHGEPDPDGRLAAVLRGLTPPLGVYAVLGNHEAHAGGEAARRFLEAGGARVLHDEWVLLRPGLVLAGVTDPRLIGRRGGDLPERILVALADRPPDAATILLQHRPEDAEVAAGAGAGLFLAGHTHGGQIWPASYISRAVNPLFDGRYEVGGMTVIVSRGMGTWGPRMRLWQAGALPRITLRAPRPAGRGARGTRCGRRRDALFSPPRIRPSTPARGR